MRVVAAMSGGVDSSVAAALLQEQGHEVVGISMQLHDRTEGAGPSFGRCCALDDLHDARAVAHRLRIPPAPRPTRLRKAISTSPSIHSPLNLASVAAVGALVGVTIADPLRIDRTKRVVERVWKAIEGEVFYPAPSTMSCTGCPYRDPCRKWCG